MAQLVEHHLAKVGVAGSNPVVRSRMQQAGHNMAGLFKLATWPSGKAEACKAFTPGSNPGVASRKLKPPYRAAFFMIKGGVRCGYCTVTRTPT